LGTLRRGKGTGTPCRPQRPRHRFPAPCPVTQTGHGPTGHLCSEGREVSRSLASLTLVSQSCPLPQCPSSPSVSLSYPGSPWSSVRTSLPSQSTCAGRRSPGGLWLNPVVQRADVTVPMGGRLLPWEDKPSASHTWPPGDE
jgi:hypothetical protein